MSQSVETEAPSVDEIDQYGDVRLSITVEDMLSLGFEYADMVKVSFLDQSIVIPVIPSYRYVAAKTAGLFLNRDYHDRPVELALFNGSFASTYGLAELTTREDGTSGYEAMEGIEFPVAVTIEMAEKGGYKDTYAIYDLQRFRSLDDYKGMSILV